MSKWLLPALEAKQASTAPPDTSTKADNRLAIVGDTPFCQVLSMSRAAATPPATEACAPHEPIIEDPPAEPDEEGFCHTWTGRVVSLIEWRTMSRWDRHGPEGRLFCGICRRWTRRDDICRNQDCWKEGTR